MGLLLHRMSRGKSKVLAIGEDGKLIEYGEKRRKLKRWPRKEQNRRPIPDVVGATYRT